MSHAQAEASKAFLNLTSDHINSSITSVAWFQDLHNHSTKSTNAHQAFTSRFCQNSSALNHATSANFATSADHVATATFIVFNALDIADHHASELIHTDDKAVPIPSMSCADNHACFPAGQRNLVNCMMSFSVVAKLFHKSTSVDHSCHTDDIGN